MDKHLSGTVTAGGATGVVMLNHGRPRPQRESAARVAPLTDGPYAFVDVQGLEDISVSVSVTAGGATVSLEGTNGNPNDSGAVWVALDTPVALVSSGTKVALFKYGGAIRFVRVAWTAGTTLGATVEVYARG